MTHCKSKTCCFTGHRKLPFEHLNEITKRTRSILLFLIKEGYSYFWVGGALGFDTLVAKIILDLKKDYPQIQLILCIPCESQTKYWAEDDRKTYENIKRSADEVICISKDYFKGCMHKRNRCLVDNSSICVCYLTEKSGGTAYTVDYAKKNQLSVFNIAEKNAL